MCGQSPTRRASPRRSEHSAADPHNPPRWAEASVASQKIVRHLARRRSVPPGARGAAWTRRSGRPRAGARRPPVCSSPATAAAPNAPRPRRAPPPRRAPAPRGGPESPANGSATRQAVRLWNGRRSGRDVTHAAVKVTAIPRDPSLRAFPGRARWHELCVLEQHDCSCRTRYEARSIDVGRGRSPGADAVGLAAGATLGAQARLSSVPAV